MEFAVALAMLSLALESLSVACLCSTWAMIFIFCCAFHVMSVWNCLLACTGRQVNGWFESQHQSVFFCQNKLPKPHNDIMSHKSLIATKMQQDMCIDGVIFYMGGSKMVQDGLR